MWREAMRSALRRRKWYENPHGFPVGRGPLARARCFDLTSIQALTYATATELRRAATRNEGRLEVDLGERVCVPAPVTWLEFNDLAILISNGDPLTDAEVRPFIEANTWVALVNVTYRDSANKEYPVIGAFSLRLNDGVATLETEKSFTRRALSTQEVETASFLMLASLAAINSPAAMRSTIEPHRGWAKRFAAAGIQLDPRIEHTRVTIGAAKGCSNSASIQGHPKAYHFCRAHTRLKRGKVERVRAHWRGDPAFGYRLPSYRVLGPSQGVVA